MTWGAAQLGIAQGVLDAVADGLIEATADLLVLVAVWVDPAASDETAVRQANRDGGAEGDRRLRRGPRPGGRRAPRRAAGLAPEPVLRRRVMRIAAVETRRVRIPARAAAARRLGSRAAGAAGGDGGRRPLRRRARGLRERRRAPRPRAARAAARRDRPAAHRARARDLRDGRLPPRAAVVARGRGLGPRRARARRALRATARWAQRVARGLRVHVRAAAGGGAGAPLRSPCATRGSGP